MLIENNQIENTLYFLKKTTYISLELNMSHANEQMQRKIGVSKLDFVYILVIFVQKNHIT